MIDTWSSTPTDLWIELGKLFYSRERERHIDQNRGGRRYVSIKNTLTIASWPKEWTGKALFYLVGYSAKGTKMNTLRRTYVDEDKLKAFLDKAKEVRKKGYSVIGMQFNMSLEKKGGCLSSMQLLQSKEENVLFIQGKVAEFPRKFLADLQLVNDLVHEINLWPIKVIFMYSTVFFSIVTLRAYLPVLSMDVLKYTKGIQIIEERNYHASIIARLVEIRKEILKKYPDGCLGAINKRTGEWNETSK